MGTNFNREIFGDGRKGLDLVATRTGDGDRTHFWMNSFFHNGPVPSMGGERLQYQIFLTHIKSERWLPLAGFKSTELVVGVEPPQ